MSAKSILLTLALVAGGFYTAGCTIPPLKTADSYEQTTFRAKAERRYRCAELRNGDKFDQLEAKEVCPN